MKVLICLIIATVLTAVFYGMLKYFSKKNKRLSTSIENYGFFYGIAISGISIILSILLFLSLSSCSNSKIYHIEVVDSNGYLMDYWGTVCEYEIKDSVLSINNGMFEYKMKPGETIRIDYDNPNRL